MTVHLRSPAALLGLACYAVGLVWVASLQSFAWLGDSLWGQESLALASIVALPILLAVVAHDGAQDRRQLLPLLSPRQRAHHTLMIVSSRFLPAAALLLFAHVAVWLSSSQQELNFANGSPWPVVTQTLGLLLAILFAYLVGLQIPSWAAAAVAPGLWIIAIFADRTSLLPTGIVEFSPSGSLLGYVPDTSEFLTRAIWMVAIALLLVASVTSFTSRFQGALWTTLVLVFLSGVLLNGDSDGYNFASAETAHCAGEVAKVCGPKELAPRIDKVHSGVEEASRALRRLGVTPPSSYVAWTAATDSSHEPWLLLVNPGKPRESVPFADVLAQVVAPQSCKVWWGSEPPPSAWFTAQTLVADWVRFQLDITPSPLYAEFVNSTPVDQQNTVLRQAATALMRCDVGLLPDEQQLPTL